MSSNSDVCWKIIVGILTLRAGTYRPGHAAADTAYVTQFCTTKYTTVNWVQFLPVMILHNIQNHPWLILFNETERAQCFHDKKHSFTQRKLVLTKSIYIYRYYIILYTHMYIYNLSISVFNLKFFFFYIVLRNNDLPGVSNNVYFICIYLYY